MNGQLGAKAFLLTAQMSVYISEKPGEEGSADTTTRAYLEGGVSLKADAGCFFGISATEGEFRSQEIILSPPTDAQNIFSGRISGMPPAIYFVPAGWKTYSYCGAKFSPKAALGSLRIEFSEVADKLHCRMPNGEEALAQMGACASAKFSGGAQCSVIYGNEEIVPDEIMLSAECQIGGKSIGAAILAHVAEQKNFLLLSRKDKPNIEIIAPQGGKNPVDATHLLIASPESFGGEISILYYAPKEANVRIELFDVFGVGRQVAVEERAGAGAHEIRMDGKALAPGPYTIRYMIDGIMAAKASVTRKFDRLF